MPDFKHLILERAPLENERRTRTHNIPQHRRGDLRRHSELLIEALNSSVQSARQQSIARPGNYVLKIRYAGTLDVKNLYKHGVSFLSQEDRQLCVVFADEAGLSKFADHLRKLGLEDDELTYKQILEAMEGIDSWTASDRTSWALGKYGFPQQERFNLDVELWPVGVVQQPDRQAICEAFLQWSIQSGIRVVDQINLDSFLAYRLNVNADQATLLLNHVDVRLVDLTPSSGISYGQLNCDIDHLPNNIPSPSERASRICILDSGIAANHPLIAPAMAESVDFIGGDGSDLNGHGTAVASIALYGDLESCKESNFWQPELLLLSGRVLNDKAEFDVASIEKTIVEAITYFVEEHECRIFNLSLGNANAPYDGRHIRGIAYVLDKLARDLNVLFVVSSGNFHGSSDPMLPINSWREEYPEYLLAEQNLIIDPAPALNVITVGSVARHNATFDAQRYPEINQLAPASENQPSPFTRRGPSVKGAIKPEVVAIGGNLASPVRNNQQHQAVMKGMGVLSCNSRFVGNTLFSEISGASFAAPYVTHLAGRLLNNYPQASANLLRALIVNHSNLPSEIESTFSNEIKKTYRDTNRRDCHRDIGGYGMVDESELFRSSENAVVLISEDKIENNAHHFFELPLPPEFLRTERATREIRVTLAYCPAVRTTRLDYIATKMHFRLITGESLETIQRYFNHDTQGETESRNDDAVGNRDISADLRGRGTVQSSTWRMKQRNPDEKWFVVVTRQDKDWAQTLSDELENYALVVTVTDRENENARLYTQISQRIELQSQARARAIQ